MCWLQANAVTTLRLAIRVLVNIWFFIMILQTLHRGVLLGEMEMVEVHVEATDSRIILHDVFNQLQRVPNGCTPNLMLLNWAIILSPLDEDDWPVQSTRLCVEEYHVTMIRESYTMFRLLRGQ
jgi:hypothetical protein